MAANVLDYNIVESEFEPKSRYYVHLRTNTLEKCMNPLIIPAMVKTETTTFSNKDIFGIKWPTQIDMLSNKETEPRT